MQRRHISWNLNRTPIYPVDVPKKSEKADYWFESSETFVVIPRQFRVPAGDWVEFSVSSRLRLLSVLAVPAAKAASTHAQPASSITALEISSVPAAAEAASRELHERYGVAPRKQINSRGTASESNQPEWLTLAHARPGTASTVAGSLVPGSHMLRANGDHDLLIMACASGLQMQLK